MHECTEYLPVWSLEACHIHPGAVRLPRFEAFIVVTRLHPISMKYCECRFLERLEEDF